MGDKVDQEHAEKRLFDEIDKHRQGMLGVVGGAPHHFQPMTQFRKDDDRSALWFFTRDDTELVSHVDEGKAMFILQNDKFQACVGGRLHIARDQAVIDQFWNPVIAAWYPDGKDDPHLTLLRFDLEDAELWLSEAGPLRFTFEVAKANLTKTTPDVGDQVHLNLN